MRAWEFRFVPLLAEWFRTKRRARTGVFRHPDERYARVADSEPDVQHGRARDCPGPGGTAARLTVAP